MKRRGHATTIYPITNGRGLAGFMYKNSIARALYTLYSLVGGWLNISYPADSSIIRRIHSIYTL